MSSKTRLMMLLCAGSLALLACGSDFPDESGGGGGGNGAGGGVAAGGGSGGSGGGTTTSNCANGLDEGTATCPYGGNTLNACDRHSSGTLISIVRACGGNTPSCAAEVVNGKPYAACCPSGNVGDPRASECRH